VFTAPRLEKCRLTTLTAVDLDGDVTNGGWGLIFLGQLFRGCS